MTTIPTSSFDVATLRNALHERDAAALAGLYADDATIELVDQANPPSSPRRIEGREAIRAHLDDVFGRDVSHELETVAASSDALGYSVRCVYADGMKVVCTSTARLRDGKIAAELGVQAWDN
jgi:ketosteroid isomerase-like protein